MPGYSGTPLPKKLGIKEGFRAALLHAPDDVRTQLRETLNGCEVVREACNALDFAMVFTESRAELAKEFKRVAKELAPGGNALGELAEEDFWRENGSE
jgi:hypothetical protein